MKGKRSKKDGTKETVAEAKDSVLNLVIDLMVNEFSSKEQSCKKGSEYHVQTNEFSKVSKGNG